MRRANDPPREPREPAVAGREPPEPVELDVDGWGPLDARPVDYSPLDARPTDARPTHARPTDARPTDAAPTGAAPTGGGLPEGGSPYAGALDAGAPDAGVLDAGPIGIEPTGADADEVDHRPLAASEPGEVGGATAGVLGEGRETPRSHRRPRGSAVGHVREPELEYFWRGWLGRSTALLFGALLLGTAFLASYLGALHNPRPKDLPVAVVAGDTAAQALLTGVRTASGGALIAKEYPTAAQATDALDRRTVYAILATDGSSTAGGLSLTLSGAAAPGATEVIGPAISAAAGTAQVPLTITDVHPLSPEDPRGLTAFYTVVGLLVGGYLAATALAIVLGTVPRNLDRLGLRLTAFGVFALLLGLAAALLTGPVYDIWSAHFVGLWLSAALIAFVGASVTAALEAWLGLIGTGLAMLLLFILGNPGSGGVFAPQFLPGIYGAMHWWNPTGLATDLLRGVAYFDRQATGWPVTGLVLWAVAGILAVLGATAALGRRVHASR